MEYGIRELSQLAGVSARTLRYYDEIGLLKPLYISEAGYRFYGENEVNLLQQILFYRERGFDLKRIRQILYETEFNLLDALEEHLKELEQQKNHMDTLIWTVKQTILSMKGETAMSDTDKFTAFKERILQENETRYGQEARKKYGAAQVEASNRKLLNMSLEQWEHFQALEQEILQRLEAGVQTGMAPDSREAGEIVRLHKEWLMMTWRQYSKEAHIGLAVMYVADERFTRYYDRNIKGCARFLKQAIVHWLKTEELA